MIVEVGGLNFVFPRHSFCRREQLKELACWLCVRTNSNDLYRTIVWVLGSFRKMKDSIENTASTYLLFNIYTT